MDMYGYGTTEQGKYFYFRRQYKFFYCSYVFSPVFPFFLNFFSMAGSPMKFAEMPTSEECEGGVVKTPPPIAMSLGVIPDKPCEYC